ncbi:MAG: hypothetical protein J7K73_00085 [Nanoarchaeota archaeon]|nr:hypothetical protein [Nanoarchaeota archaeon]
MENSKMAKKAQYAATLILIGMAALFIIYTILAYPEEKARILNVTIPNQTSAQITESPLGEGTYLIFSSGEISEIGRSSGETVFSFSLPDVYVAYPVEEKILDEKDISLKASILKGSTSYFAADNLNLENTKEVTISINVTYLEGNPNLIVMLNNSKIFENTITKTGMVTIHIPKVYLKENNPIALKLTHNGAFWTTNVLAANVKIIQAYYNPKQTVDEKYVTLGQTNIKGNELKISFIPLKVVGDGDLIVKLNGKIIFSGKVEEKELFSITERLDESGVKVGDNTITFEADKGGVYNLTFVKFEFVAVSTPATNKVYAFDIPKEYLSSNEIILGIRVDKIIKPGYIYAKIGDDGPLYYFENSDLASGAWSYTVLDKTYLKELGNKITLDSPNGRYRVTGLVIIAK